MDQSGFREVFEALLNEYEAQGMGKSAAAAAALREATTQMEIAHGTPQVAAEALKKEPAVAPPEAPVKPMVRRAPPPVLPEERIEPEISPEFVRDTLAECRTSGSFGALIKPVYALFSSEVSLAKAYFAKRSSKNEKDCARMDVDSSTDDGMGTESAMTNTMDTSQDAGGAEEEGGDVNVDLSLEGDGGISVDRATIAEVFELLLTSSSEGVVNSLFHALTSLVSQLQPGRGQTHRLALLLLALPVVLHSSSTQITDAQREVFVPLEKSILGIPGAVSAASRERLVRFLRVSPNALEGDEDVKLLDLYIKICTGTIEKCCSPDKATGSVNPDVLRLCRTLSVFYVSATGYDIRKYTEWGSGVAFAQEQVRLASEGSTRGLEFFPHSLFILPALNEHYLGTQNLRDRGSEFYRWFEEDAESTKSLWSDMSTNDLDHAESSVPACTLSPGQRYEMLRCRLYVSRADRLQSVYSFPFLLSPANKAKLLQLEARVEQQRQERLEMRQARERGQEYITTSSLYLVFSVRREHLLEDTLNRLAAIEPGEEREFKKELKVMFDGEDGVDAGGVRKEYYMLMLKQLLDLDFGMFSQPSRHKQGLLWFNSDSFSDMLREFELIGVLVGIALYNSILLDLRMPTALFKKLKGEKVGLADLAQLQPELAKGLQSLLDFDGDVKEAFDFSFELSHESMGSVKTHVLMYDGTGQAALPVTNENREQYVQCYCDYLLNESVEVQFNSFKSGFDKVIDGFSCTYLSGGELEVIVCGQTDLDFHDLQAGCTYQDGYDADSPAVAMFWQVLYEFDNAEKKAFLRFLTGSDRCPVGGLRAVELVVSRNTDEEARLPSAHTCFNHLLLPEYKSLEVMRERVRFAMGETEGFGLR